MTIGLIATIVLLAVVCAALVWLTKNFKREAEQERAAKQALDSEIRALIAGRAALQSTLDAERAAARQREQERDLIEERFSAQFKALSSEILSKQSQEFKHSNAESIMALLSPFKSRIEDFNRRVEDIYSSENRQRGELKQQLQSLLELNNRITAETNNLTRALKGNSKVQGDWGEMILETILDNSNLERGVHYLTQHNIKDEEGNNLRPDVVLLLPEGKRIIIDSKVSLTAFVDFNAADNEAERKVCLARHIESVRKHVTELGRKEYQKLLDSPDFVIMFVPNEPAFLSAMQNDSTIWSDAYEKKVIISSPTNLFALLKLADDLWKRDSQNKNNQEIVVCATKLYEQMVAFTESLTGVGEALDKAQLRYNDAYKRLHTGNDNIVRVGERLRGLGLKAKKNISSNLIAAADESPDSTPTAATQRDE